MNRFILMAGLAVLYLLSLLGCSSEQQVPSKNSNASATSSSGFSKEAELRIRLERRLADDEDFKDSVIRVRTESGIVTLTGVVDSEGKKHKAEDIAKKFEGVRQVVNNIAVEKKPIDPKKPGGPRRK
jgi:osmotically-inducible protein OsmY